MRALFIHFFSFFPLGASKQCNHGFAPGENKVCCDHLADKSTFQPLRIKKLWNPPQDFNATYTQFTTDAIAEATNYWMSTLKVHRSVDNLRVKGGGNDMLSATGVFFLKDYPDIRFWTLRPGKTKEDFKAELGNGFSAGHDVTLPDVIRGEEVTICEINKNPKSHPTECETIPQAAGIAADLVIVFHLHECHGKEETLASASPLYWDQCDRPTVGQVKICKKSIQELFTKPEYNQHTMAQRKKYAILILVHEVSHILAFSSDSFEYFRKPNGGAMVPRGPSGALDQIQLTCKETDDVAYVDLAKHNIVKLAPYYGHDVGQCKCAGLSARSTPAQIQECFKPFVDKNAAPSCVFVLATPKVKAAARRYFDCDSLEGMPLENKPTSDCRIFGSHWENHLIRGEAMTPFINLGQQGKFISTMTLALMEDSGWYAADYSFATSLVPGVHYGYKAGCEFFTQKCSEDHPTPGYFCRQEEQSCSRGLRAKMQCATCQPGQTRLPEVWQYFRNPKTKCDSGVSSAHCPIFSTRVGDCRFPGHHLAESYHGETAGEQSFCFMSSWYQIERKWVVSESSKAERPQCFEVKCAADKQSYTLYMITEQNGEPVEVGVCSAAGDTIDPRDSLAFKSTQDHQVGGRVTCHAPQKVCRETNDYFNGMDFSQGPVVLHKGWSSSTTTTTTTTTSTSTFTSTTSTSTSTSTFTSTSTTTTPSSSSSFPSFSSAGEIAGAVIASVVALAAIVILAWHIKTVCCAGARLQERAQKATAIPNHGPQPRTVLGRDHDTMNAGIRKDWENV